MTRIESTDEARTELSPTSDLRGAPVSGFWTCYATLLLHPRPALERLSASPRALRVGTQALLLTAVLYTLMYFFLTLGGAAPSTFAPWLAIPRDVYYRYNTLLLAPSMFLCWVTASGTAQLLARAWGGRGSFEQTAAAIGVSISLASWTTLIHDLIGSSLGALHVIDARAHEVAMNSPTFWRALILTLFVLYASAFLYLFSTSIAITQRLSRLRSMVLGALTFVVYQGLFLVFNR